MKTKKCFRCTKVKSLSAYYVHKQMKDGHLNKCKDCAKKDATNYRWSNINKVRADDRNRWRNKSRDNIYLRLKQSSRGHLVVISEKDFYAWYESQSRECSYCGIEEKKLPVNSDSFNKRTPYLTIDKKNAKDGYKKGNLALCCLRCNSIKSNFFTSSEMVEIGRKYISKKW